MSAHDGAPVRAFVQARMSSRRFPGKMLAPLHGEPLIVHVVRAAGHIVGPENVVVATSSDRSDDPLALYLESIGTVVERGPLDDVIGRFRLCAERHPCDWILRVCGDSPRFDVEIGRRVVEAAEATLDLVTSVFPRTVPHGHSAELIRAASLAALPDDELDAEDREHVTRFFYRNPERFTIRNLDLSDVTTADESVVDTIEDLHRLEES
ncbi:MAG: cytidylyltransferase domain-containing protein [Gaiellaceae bacterium]